MSDFSGCYTVMVTPFTDDGAKVDYSALRRCVDWQISNGVPGLIPLGSTGEFLSVSEEERREIALNYDQHDHAFDITETTQNNQHYLL